MNRPQPVEFAYLDLLDDVLRNGQRRPGTRTGVDTIGVWDRRLVADLRDGFPLLTTKELPFKSIRAELCGFLCAATSAQIFRVLGTRIWDANANKTVAWLRNPARKGEDDLGRIYGAQWREWRGPDGVIDQIDTLLDGLRHDPYGRRHIVSAWNTGELDRMALPPCHVMFQCYVEDTTAGRVLHLKMTQRSADLFLGVPFNLASYAMLLQLLATVTGMIAGQVTLDFGDVHLYENHLKQAATQCDRLPYNAPALAVDTDLLRTEIEQFRAGGVISRALRSVPPDALLLMGYTSHPALPAQMAA